MRPDRDDPLVPAIRRALQDSRTDCPDAATVAAYADRSLTGAEHRDLEQHLSACARCRETLLLMSRAAEAEKGTATFFQKVKKGGSPLYWPWLAGATAAALAVVVWTTAGRQELDYSAPAPAAAAQPIAPGGDQIAARADQNKAPETAERQLKKPDGPPAAPPAQIAPKAQDKRLVDSMAKRRDADREESGRDFEATKTHAQAKTEAEPKKPAAVAETVVTAPPPAAPPPPAAQPATTMAERDAAASNRAAPASGARERFGALARQQVPLVSSPTAAVRWRVLPPAGVERSSDAGATWTREPVEAPDALAIQSPSRDVCWIAGAGGLILRYDTVGGWRRVSPPIVADFTAVQADDARRATVTAADGRRFTTADGGLTWK